MEIHFLKTIIIFFSLGIFLLYVHKFNQFFSGVERVVIVPFIGVGVGIMFAQILFTLIRVIRAFF